MIFLWGIHAVKAALENKKRKIRKIVTTQENFNLLKKPKGPFEIVTREEMGPWAKKIAGDSVHQWILADADPFPSLSLKDLPSGPLRILILDNVCDPQNIGSLLRSAAALGFSYVIAVERSMPVLGGVLAKVASGALECVNIILVPNLAQALRFLKTIHVWSVGLDHNGTSSLEDIKNFERLAFVLGAEGAGLRLQTKTHCDFLVSLKTHPHFPVLNVSSSGAIAMHACMKL